jgi:hypothetical protein
VPLFIVGIGTARRALSKFGAGIARVGVSRSPLDDAPGPSSPPT